MRFLANIKHPRIFYTLGLYRGYMGSWDEAKRTHLAGLAHHTPAQDDPERARLLHGLAEALFMRGKPDSAGQVLDSAFVLAEKYDERLLKYRLVLLSSRIQIQSYLSMEAQIGRASCRERV